MIICHTGLFTAVRDYGWENEAGSDSWQTHRFTRGNLMSNLLLRPCNLTGKSKYEVAGHRILAIREKCGNGTHKLHILDSLGKESGRRWTHHSRKADKNSLFPNVL